MEHRLCLGDFLDPASSSNQDQVNVVVELNTLKEKFAELEQTKSVPVEQKQKGKKKDKVKKKDKKGKNQADLFKKLNENLALTCTLYNQVYLVRIFPASPDYVFTFRVSVLGLLVLASINAQESCPAPDSVGRCILLRSAESEAVCHLCDFDFIVYDLTESRPLPLHRRVQLDSCLTLNLFLLSDLMASSS